MSPTHLHEFKSADKSGAPVMSLYLPEQKVGSHSTEGGSSNKFVLKGRQTGSMHRGHTWVFRAESHDTMMAWYEDIKALTEKSPEERNNFVRGHVRSLSRSSQRSISSDGMNEEDEEPFVSQENAAAVMASPGSRHESINRPAPGGRFPSDLQVNAQRGMQVPLSPSSQSSGFDNTSEFAMRGGSGGISNGNRVSDYETIAAAGAIPGSGIGEKYQGHGSSHPNVDQSYGNTASHLNVGKSYGNTPSIMNLDSAPSHAEMLHQQAVQDGINPYNGEPASLRRNSSHRSVAAPIIIAGTQASHLRDRNISQEPEYIPQNQEHNETLAYTGQAVPTAPTINYGTADYITSKTEATQTTSATGNGFATHGNDLQAQNGFARPAAGRRMDSTPHVPGEYPRYLPQTPNVI